MKFNILALIIISAFILQTRAQQTQVFAIAGYQINSDITVARGDLSFDDAVSYGAGVDVEVQRGMQAEISWSMSASNVVLQEYLGPRVELGDVYIHHFQAGALIEPERKKVSPFGLIGLGATLFHPTEIDYKDEVRFSISLGLGFKVYVSDKVGLRFQGRMIIPMQITGGSVWFGSGGAGVSCRYLYSIG